MLSILSKSGDRHRFNADARWVSAFEKKPLKKIMRF